MANKGQETEAKFYVTHLARAAARLDELHARLNQSARAGDQSPLRPSRWQPHNERARPAFET